MWYITYDNWNGGLAHNFCGLLTSLIISEVFGIEYVHTHMSIALGNAEWLKHEGANTWEGLVFADFEKFFNFKGGNRDIGDLRKPNRDVSICKNPSFGFITLAEIGNCLKGYNRNEDIVFRLTNNNNIWMWTFYDLCNRNVVNINLFNKIRNNLMHNVRYKPVIRRGEVSLHIRKGDCNDDIEWGYSILKNIGKTYKIDRVNIYAMGTQKQMREIIDYYSSKKIDNIEYKLNFDTIKSVEGMMGSEILVCSMHGFFSKTVGYFTDTIKFYGHFLDHGINLTSGGPLFPGYLCGNKPECYDVRDNELYNFSINRIKCDIDGNFSNEQFQKSLKHTNE
jgi:hypothetical protein